MAYKFLVASYTDSIVTLGFEPRESSLHVLSSLKVGHHPSWIARHSSDSSIFFAGLEQSDGRLLTLKFDTESGSGELLNDSPSHGSDPCTILVTDEDILVGNYSSGTVGVYSLPSDPSYPLKDRQPAIQFFGSGPNKDRQESSHPHQVYLRRAETAEILIPDLGANKTWRLVRNFKDVWEKKAEILYEEFPGGGPRHIGIYDDILYTLLELTSELTAHSLPPLSHEGSEQISPVLLASSSTLLAPPVSSSLPQLAAELLIPSPNDSFPTPYIYISNRNDPHPSGDTISIFSVFSPNPQPVPNGIHNDLPHVVPEWGTLHSEEKGTLKLLNEIHTGLAHLRGMIFFGPDDRYLIAGGANGGGIKVFERTKGGASLQEVAHLPSEDGTKEGLSPTGFVSL